MSRPTAVADALAAATAWGLDADLAPPAEPLEDDTWAAVLRGAVHERVLGPLYGAVGSGEWPTTEEQARSLAETHRSWMATAVVLERELLHVGTQLDEAGVPFLVLKGTALAHLVEDDPSHRCYGDVDLLVRGLDLATVERLLVAGGGQRRYREPRPGFDRTFTKGMAVVQSNRLEIDVHRTLTGGPFGLAVDLDDLWSEPASFEVGGTMLAALGPRQRFVHACIHALLGSAVPHLLPIRDVARTAPREWHGPAGIRATLDLAGRWRCEAVVAAAVRETSARLGWRAPRELAAWASSQVDDRRERRWLAAYQGTGRSSAALALTAVEAVPGLTAKARYLAAVALPAGAAHGDARRRRWHRGVDGLRRTLDRARGA